jgi:hypothetical protein
MATLDDLARMITAHRQRYDPPLPREAFQNVANYTASVIQARFAVPILPKPGETVGVAPDCPKTAALFFDRLWSMPHIESAPPASIHVYGATPYEIWILALFALAPEAPLDVIEQIFPDNPTAAATTRSRVAARDIANALTLGRKIPAVPVYSSGRACSEEYKPGKYEVLVAALANLNIPDESALTWDQVVQFRSDPHAKMAYRRLVHWADKELVGRSMQFVEDELALRLDAYSAGLQKHGIRTVLGALDAMFDPSFVQPASAVVAALALGGSLPAAEWGAAVLFGGKFACKLARGLLDISDAKQGPNSEIAFVYDVARTPKIDEPEWDKSSL